MKLMRCKVCGNSSVTKIFEVREMMFGFRDKFTYFQCPECECLQISEFPENIAEYYPSGYYSFQTSFSKSIKRDIKERVRKKRNQFAYHNNGTLGKFICKFYPNEVLKLISIIDLSVNDAVLDVGCGSGTLLLDMKQLGFNNLLGVDPFLEKDIDYKNGLKILKKSIHEVEGKWDLIMLHHSFEHIPDPLETLQSVSKLLNKGGTCLIRIPTASSYAWEHYRENWVQIDAPRHYFLHSIKSLTLLSEKVDLSLEKVMYDSTDFQFWGSEQYIKDIILTDSRSRFIHSTNKIFSKKEIKDFKKRANQLNQDNCGDSVAVFLKKR